MRGTNSLPCNVPVNDTLQERCVIVKGRSGHTWNLARFIPEPDSHRLFVKGTLAELRYFLRSHRAALELESGNGGWRQFAKIRWVNGAEVALCSDVKAD